jgi:endo-1,4-beta-xylanase
MRRRSSAFRTCAGSVLFALLGCTRGSESPSPASGGAPSTAGTGDSGGGAATGSGGAAGSGGAPYGIAGRAAETIRACQAQPRDSGGQSGQGGEAGQAGDAHAASLPTSFQWSSSDPLILPQTDERHANLSIKDPSIVYFEGRWHVFATTANVAGAWSMVYLSFADWSEAATAEQHYLGDYPALGGYHAAPQIFYFAPQKKWYLSFQSGQPQYTTTDDLTQPDSWVTPKNYFVGTPQIVLDNKGSGTWLDFWNICDTKRCYLFFTDDNGNFYRSETSIESFPEGFSEPVVAIKGTKETVFEGSETYRVEGTGRYLTMVEAFGPSGQRYFRSLVADSLDGEWSPLAADWSNPFAGLENVTFESGNAWTRDVSHGELLRTNYDQTPTISLSCLRFLYQGTDPRSTVDEYYRIPWRLALLTRTE